MSRREQQVKRPRGNRRPRVAVEARRAEVAAELAKGASGDELAQALGVSRTTIWRDLQEIAAKVNALPRSLELFQQHRETVLAELQKLKELTLHSADFNDRDRVGALLQINDRLIDLLALNDPQLVRAATGATAPPQTITVQYVGPEHTQEVMSPEMCPTSALALPPHDAEAPIPKPEPTLDELMDEYHRSIGEQS